MTRPPFADADTTARLPVARATWPIGGDVAPIAIGAHAQSVGTSADTLPSDAAMGLEPLDAGQWRLTGYAPSTSPSGTP
ncbi:membrane protein [Burkholderia aenigmatica]|uniref:Membrane protein n=1 Tax=Burkholderia aenigmatica TaxID=2015348 RepID=A0A6J5JK85_9BURK|nr:MULTISPECIES: hypothetical protein [Burkholderia]CAB3971527.1 membrane protein [Burkholderia aenigmatica]